MFSVAVSDLTECPKRTAGLDINPAEEGYIIYQAEFDRVHYLNPTAVFILELCDGERSVSEITKLVSEAYELAEPPLAQVEEAIEKMKHEGLLE
jgi:methyltransferase-like protein